MPEFIFFIMFVTFVSGIGVLILWKLFDIVRNSIKKNKGSYDEDRFDKLAKAFIQHRKKTDKRLENIESILTEEKVAHGPLDQPHNTQTIETSGFGDNHSSENRNKRRTK